MMTDDSKAPFAAAVYKPGTGDRMALMKFVEKQKARNIRVGGVLQEARYDAEGRTLGFSVVDIATNRRIPITRPVGSNRECILDVSALTETTAIMRSAIDERPDLVVVEKFGELEQSGKGFIDEVLQAIVEGIPLLISVPEAALPLWQERSGELGSVLPFTEEAFEQWWHNLE